MGATTNLALPYPAAADNPQAPVLASLAAAVDAQAAPWTTYATSLTENAVAVTFSALYSKYRQIGKTCMFKQKLQITGSGTSGIIVVGLPPPDPRYTTSDNGMGMLFTIRPSGSTPTWAELQVVSGSTSTAKTQATIGFNLTNTCFIWTWGQYEVA